MIMTKLQPSDTSRNALIGLEGKRAVITGGAGILGQAICRALAESGIQTAILDLNQEAATQLACQLQTQTGTRCIAANADVLCQESLEQARQIIEDELGPTDFLINAAGGNSPRATTGKEEITAENGGPTIADSFKETFFDLDQHGFQSVFDLNFLGTLLPSQVFGRGMVQRKAGVILNISSMNSFRPLTKIPAYSAAKASINNFTQWLAVHLAKTGVRVNAIAPGFFLTDQNRFLLTDRQTGEPTPRGLKIIANTPMGRYGHPDDLKGAVLFLLSDASAFITGVVMPIDGGYSAFGGV
jgi:NAD(P)-dependent dehydrogenase (short-subunit alcohol dehydrogenase family)